MSQPLIELKNVSKKYGFKEGLRNINLSLSKGGIIGLVGTNGSGKSTLLKLLAGFVQPSKGSVLISGQKANRRRGDIVAFQSDKEALYPFYTVEETLRFSDKVFPSFDLKKAYELISHFHLDLKQPVKNLSKGYLARLKMAVTLARKLPLTLMDEPLSGIDPIARGEMIQNIASHIDLEQQTLLLSTHEVDEIEHLLDHVILLHEGKVVYSENVELLRESRNVSVLEIMKEVAK